MPSHTPSERHSSGATPDSPRVDRLENVLRGEVDAIRNDLHQAQALASEYQRQLSHKANDVAVLKHSLEKAMADLEKMQTTVAQLRAERQHLSDEALRALVLERRLALVTARLDHLERQRISDASAPAEEPSSVPVPTPVPTKPKEVNRGTPPVASPPNGATPREEARIEITFSNDSGANVVIVPDPQRTGRTIYRA